jgi:hypothetical protein
VEFQCRERAEQGFPVRLPPAEPLEVQRDGHVLLDGDELLRQARVVGVGEQRLAGALGLHLGGVREDGLQVGVGREQFAGALVADALHTRHVVRAVPDQRQVIHHLPRWHAQPVAGVGLVHPDLFDRTGAAAAGIEQGDVGADQLVEVLVAGDDDGLQAARGRLGGERADHVIRLVALDRDERYPPRGEEFLDPLDGGVEVDLQLFVELLARGFVLGVTLGAEGVAGVVHPHDVFRSMGLEQPGEEIGHAPRRGRVLALGGAERPRDHREEGAIDQRVAVDEEETRRGYGACLRTRASTRSNSLRDSGVRRKRPKPVSSQK